MRHISRSIPGCAHVLSPREDLATHVGLIARVGAQAAHDGDAVDLVAEAKKLWGGDTIEARDGLRLEI